jgi:hypothetical protein
MDPTTKQSIIQALIPMIPSAVIAVLSTWAWCRWWLKREIRLIKNLNRPILILGTEDQPLDHEVDLLKRTELFPHLEGPKPDPRSVDLLNGKRLAIIGYSPNEHFRNAYKAAQVREIPVLVYAAPDQISRESGDMELIRSYSHHSLCNTPLRLVSDVFALMSTYPEKH